MWNIEFNPALGGWSPFIFWYVAVNAILCVIFTIVVAIGGVFDLRYLLRALREAPIDEADDGRIAQPADPTLDA